LEKAREGRLEQGHQHKLLQGTEYYLYEINVFSIMRRTAPFICVVAAQILCHISEVVNINWLFYFKKKKLSL